MKKIPSLGDKPVRFRRLVLSPEHAEPHGCHGAPARADHGPWRGVQLCRSHGRAKPCPPRAGRQAGGTEQPRWEGRRSPRGIWWAVFFDRATERCLAAYLLLRATGWKRISFRAKCDFVLCGHRGQQGVEWKTSDVSPSCSPEFPYNRP